MTTVLDILNRAGRLIGVIRKNEALAADEAADALTSLVAMLDSWSNHSLAVYVKTEESFTLSAASSYSIGAGQTLNTVKPIKILHAVISSGGYDEPLEIINQQEYLDIPIKTIQGSPSALVYTNGHPYGTIRLYPLADSGDILKLLSEKPITNFTATSETVTFPVGWEEAIAYNLAVRIAPEYGVEIPQVVGTIARESFNAIKMTVARNTSLPYKPSSVGSGDIYNGYQ